MTNPKKVNERILTEIRHCLHSKINGSATNLLPDYTCINTGKLCVMYSEPMCQYYESFPESQDS